MPARASFVARWGEHWMTLQVGSYRRALSSYEVKMHAVQLLSEAIDEPSAFEVLHERTAAGAVDSPSSLAPDHDTFGVGQ